MPKRSVFRLCKCVLCIENGNFEGCHIDAQEWGSHQRLARAEDQRRMNSGSTKLEESITNDSEQTEVSQIMFGMAFNIELMFGSESDPLWSRNEDDTNTTIQLPVNNPFDPSALIATIDSIIDSGHSRSLYKGALKKAPIYRQVFKPARDAVERNLERALSHISTKRAEARVHRTRTCIQELESRIGYYRAYDEHVHKELGVSLGTLRHELASIKRTVPPVQNLKSELSYILDELEAKLNVITNNQTSNTAVESKGPSVYDTGKPT
jgi:hypothetical protein